MKGLVRREIVTLKFHVLSLLLFCSVVGQAATFVSGEQGDSVWTKEKSPYIIQGTVTISAGKTLTIQPGTEVHSLAYSDVIYVDGTLTAKGLANDSIRFIGFPDELDPNSSHGGTIHFNSSSTLSELEYMVIDKWGDQQYWPYSIYTSAASLSIKNCSIRNSEQTGITIAGGTPILVSCNFFNNVYDIVAQAVSLKNVSSNTNANILIQGGAAVDADAIIPKQGAGSFYQLQGSLNVLQGVTLEIKPGAEIRSMSYTDGIYVRGKLICKGLASDSIRFVGFPNPFIPGSSHGGSLNFLNTSVLSELEYVVIDRWGDAQNSRYAIYTETSNISINKTSIRNSEEMGIYMEGDIQPVVSASIFEGEQTGIYVANYAKPLVSGCTFLTSKQAISAPVGGFSNLVDNVNAKMIVRGNPAINNNAVLPKLGSGSFYQLEGGFTIGQGLTLEIKPGVEIRSLSNTDVIQIAGRLVAKGLLNDSIRFIGFPNPSVPSSSHGGYFYFLNTSALSELEYVSINRWGDADYLSYCMYTAAASLSISKSSIRHSEDKGIYVDGGSSMFTELSLTNNATGLHRVAGNITLANCKIMDNANYGINNIAADTVDARNCYWGNSSGPFHPVLNATGQGNRVSDKVKFIPWTQQLTKVDQTISQPVVATQYVGDSLLLTATASSELLVSYSVSTVPPTGVAVLIGQKLFFPSDTGTVTLTVIQQGNEYFNAAEVQRVFHVTKKSQSISFNPIVPKTFGDPDFIVTAKASSGLPVSFSITSGLAIVQDSTIHLTNAGTVVVLASQSGSQTYFAATPVQQSFIVYPKLPDLTVQDVSPNLQIIAPGDSVTLTWKEKNIGRASSAKNWMERIYIQSTNGSNRTLVTQLSFTEAGFLDSGILLPRSHVLQMPLFFNIGDEGEFVVELIPGAPIQEVQGGAGNNISIQSNSFSIKKQLAVTISPNEFLEGNPNGAVVNVTRSGSFATNLPLNLSLQQPDRFSFPANVVIPAGQSGTSFTFTANNNSFIEGNVYDTLQVSATGFQSAKAGFIVTDNDKPTLSITGLPAAAAEGQVTHFQLTTNLPHTQPLQVNLNGSNQTRFPLPTNVFIPANSFSVDIAIPLLQDSLPEIEADIFLVAGAANHIAAYDTIRLTDDDVPGLELAIQTNIISESAGYNATQAIFKRKTGSNPIGFTANLSASVPNTLIFPTSISLEAGENEKTFTVGTIDNILAEGDRMVTITASILVPSCACSAPATTAGSVSASITVTDNDGPALQMVASPLALPEGSANAGKLRISRNTSPNTALAITLTSSDSTEATVPTIINMPIGQSFVEVPVTTVDDGESDGGQQVYFQAKAPGYSTGSAWAVITDLNKPDLLFTYAKLGTDSVQALSLANYEVEVKNAGFATAASGVVVRVYLSKDQNIDNSDSLISEEIVVSAIPAGQTKKILNAKTIPDYAGQYYILFWVNATANITELVTTNNLLPALKLYITPAYSAAAVVNGEFFALGTNILIAGMASFANGAAAANKPVEVYMTNNGIRRSSIVLTDPNGKFSTQFEAMSGDAGHYTIGASFPGLGLNIVQDEFDVLGVQINNGAIPQFRLKLGDTLLGQMPVVNLSGKSLANFTLATVSLPTGLSIVFDTIAVLSANGSANIHYKITGSSLSNGNNFLIANFKARANEGEIQPFQAYYFCQPPNALLVADIEKIDIKISQTGGERFVEFKLINRGSGFSGNISIILPSAQWLSSVSPNTLPSLAPGDTSVVTIRFKATDEIPFGYPVTGNIGISPKNGNTIKIPFVFEKVSETYGAAKITVTNQFTYLSQQAANVQGAHVLIKNYYTGEVYSDGLTDGTGILAVPGLPEGRHRIIVEKESHLTHNGLIEINPGDTVSTSVFLQYQAITFTWTVVPTAVQDEYEIILTPKFETNIPVPVVIIDMPKQMPKLAANEVYPFNVTLTNHGLITANNVELLLPDTDPEYEFVTNYVKGDLLALQSLQVPVLMRRHTGTGRNNQNTGQRGTSAVMGMPATQDSGDEENCYDVVVVISSYSCNAATNQWEKGGAIFSYYGRDCSTTKIPVGNENDKINIPVFGPVPGPNSEEPINTPCVFCAELDQYFPPHWEPPFPPGQQNVKSGCSECVEALEEHIFGLLEGKLESYVLKKLGKKLTLIKKAYDLWSCLGYNTASYITGGEKTLGDIIGCLPDDLVQEITKLFGLLEILKHCLDAAFPNEIRMQQEGGSFYQESKENIEIVIHGISARNSWGREYFGNLGLQDGWNDLAPLLQTYISNLDSFDLNAQSVILNAMSGYEISQTDIQHFFNRWNLSLHALKIGVLEPNAEYPDIIDWTMVKKYSDSIVVATNQAKAKGVGSVPDLYDSTIVALYNAVNAQKSEVCASVQVQFSQRLTMTREAFEGNLEIFNGHPTDAMDSLTVTMQIRDDDGVPSNGLFEIQIKSLTNLSDVTGTGAIDAQQKGSVKFLFIPEPGAAPTAPKRYFFGGSVRYWDPYAKAMVTLPLSPVEIMVNPSPNLFLHYFMERNILGDDALTSPAVEPSKPAELAIMVENSGYGPAVNMTISSAQPKIVDNEKGLAINFTLAGSNFQGQPKQLGVKDINFGTIPPLQTRIGQWYFSSSLLGKFVSYDAKVIHANSFGNPNLSLVNGIRLHELTKSIRLYGGLEDGIGDFLVNDIFDVSDQPDIIYHSQGHITSKVTATNTAGFNQPVLQPSFTNTLSVTPPQAGWTYIKLDDPGNGLYELASITRSDGQVIPLNNAWLTFATLPVSQPPVYENKFHFVDTFPSAQAASYTVVWKPKNLDIPKIDTIVGLPNKPSSSAVKIIKVLFNKQIDPATFTYQDISLTFQGGGNLINGQVTIIQEDTASFNIDLSSITVGNGQYVLTVQAAEIADIYGTKGSSGKQAIWTQFLDVPTVEEFQGIPESREAKSFSTIQLLFNLPIDTNTVTPARFVVLKNGVGQAGAINIDSVRADKKLFYLSGLGNILTQSAQYQFVVDLPNIKSTNQIAGLQQQSILLTVDKTAPVLLAVAKLDSGALDSQHVPFIKMQFNEPLSGFNTSALQLSRNGVVLPISFNQLSNAGLESWLAGNFGLLTYPDGDYTFTINMAGVKDAAGNIGSGIQQLSWTVNHQQLIVISNLTISPDLGFSNNDGITSGQSFTVSFLLGANASQVTIAQFDQNGELLLKNMTNISAGNISIPVLLATGGNTGIRIKANGANGGSGKAEKALYIDQLPLTAKWLFAANLSLPTQVDTIPVQFSAKILSNSAVLNALQLRRNGATLFTDGLNIEPINDSLYYIKGIRTISELSGNYELIIDQQQFGKYSSGKSGSGFASVSWAVKPNNKPPIAKAGDDIIVTLPGSVTLNGLTSTDPESSSVSYQWIPPDGIVLNNLTSPTPSFTVGETFQDGSYPFLLIVSDGELSSTDVVDVQVDFSGWLRFTGLSENYCSNSGTSILTGIPSGGVFSGPGIMGNVFNPAVAGLGTHIIYYANNGNSTQKSTRVSWAPAIGADTTALLLCLEDRINLLPIFDTARLQVQWDTPTPTSVGVGKYRIIASTYAGCSDTAYAEVRQKIAIWTGALNADWHKAGNWNTGNVPDGQTHVIIPEGTPPCEISSENGTAASSQIRNGARLTIKEGKRLNLMTECNSLPFSNGFK